MAIFMPPFAAQVIAYNEWIAKIAEEAEDVGYNVTINLFPAGTLLPPPDMYEGVKSGVAEIGDMTLGGDTELFPLSNILVLPFMPVGESDDALDIWAQLRDEFPEMAAEFEDVKVLFYSGSGAEAFLLHCTNQQLVAPEDMAGIKVQAEGGMVELMDDLGAAPVTLHNMEWASALQTGIIDAMWMNWMAVGDMGLLDYLKYDTIFPSGCMFGEEIIFMNLDTWNSLPSDVQDIIEDQRTWVEERILELTVGSNAAGHQKAIDQGNTIVTLTPEQEDAWYQAALQIHMDYVAELDAQGLPATEVYERALELAGQ
jgi:TRAP-type C4-dicarboxylate transport system substrate-binding protein